MFTEKDLTEEQLAAGRALAYIERVFSSGDMCYSLEESINNITDITDCHDAPEYDKDTMTEDEGWEILAKMYAYAISISEEYVTSITGYFVIADADVFYDAMLYEDTDTATDTKIYKAMKEIAGVITSDILSERISEILTHMEHMPLARLKFIKRAMDGYMFSVDEDLFGVQTNSAGTVVSLTENGNSMAGRITQNIAGGTTNLPIRVLLVCDPDDESVIHVLFELERIRFTSDKCNCVTSAGSAGIFTQFDYTLRGTKLDEPALQSRICDTLEKCQLKLSALAEKCPDMNRILKPDEPAVCISREIRI